MLKTHILAIISVGIIGACKYQSESRLAIIAKKEILDTEKEFASMVKKVGIAKAFVFFADDSAIINRNGRLYKGKDSILFFYDQPHFKNITLEWDVEYVQVANSCDLGYTYGIFKRSTANNTGQMIEQKGIFHTVWKKQSNDKWKYVWD